MSAQPLPAPLVSSVPSPGHAVRVEYLDCREVDKHREYRFRVYGADGSTEFRLRIVTAAFDDRRLRIQDGPDLCYQKLVRGIAAGVATPHPDAITIEDADLFGYQEDHIPASKRRPWRTSPPVTPTVAPRQRPQARPRATVSPRSPAAPSVPNDVEPPLEEGQRVKHTVFGMGVTTATTSARTLVFFDRDGPKSFVASMLEVEVLSGPHTWETNRRGVNRPRRLPGGVSDAGLASPRERGSKQMASATPRRSTRSR